MAVNIKRAKVFDETCKGYLEEIKQLNFSLKAAVLGLNIYDGVLRIPLYDKIYRLDKEGITCDTGEELSPAVQVMICKYILTCPEKIPETENKLVTFRDFKDATPLISYFTTNTNKTLEATFCGNVTGLLRRGQEIGGKVMASDTHDVSLLFHAFPRVPVILNFNDQDDLFGASCSVLYRSSASYFLDMESLSMTGTLLSGKLIAGSHFA